MKDLAERPVTELKGVGPSLEALLAKLKITNLQDLLFHLPIRYEDRTRITPIGALQPYTSAVVEAEVLGAAVVMGRRRSLVVKLGDSTGITTIRYFHFNQSQKNAFRTGRRIRCFGEPRPGASGVELYHPEYSFVDDGEMELEQSLTPVYSTTEGLGQKRIRDLVAQVLSLMSPETLKDLVPGQLRFGGAETGLFDSLIELHKPPADISSELLEDGMRPGQQLLAHEELLAHQISLAQIRAQNQQESAFAANFDQSLNQKLLDFVGFAPTGAQLRVSKEIFADISKTQPMMRLLQGDVGSGKTLVAAMTALQLVGSGLQVALMAPTEILAEQHLKSFSRWFEPLGIKVVSLTGRTKGKAREALLGMIAEGKAQMVIGTQALFQDDVQFQKLGLVIIDEQHRFGVGQRFALNQKSQMNPQGTESRAHQLVMTATPIPRTLAMSHYSNLDISVIDEYPAGRQPVTTALIGRDRRDQVVESIRKACAEGRQVYWVCTLIEESENFDLQAAELAADELQLLLPELEVGLLHGRMKSAEKDQVMDKFRAGETQLLVSTTVIEVGVDVANASLMIIENPERLGLAQLHQLRGRVGRGLDQSHCILLYGTPLSNHARERLKAMRETGDGFELAEIDLRLRGPGELLGVRQTGEAGYRIADLMRDQDLLDDAKKKAPVLLENHPQSARLLVSRWVHRAEDFATV
ncbi:MAG: ATP-dependent DNA helicase RecG [Porticoccaceae bacterium]|nr:ATP-dependent DNA helicase RecG [Porticoccaceae bacterium]